MRDTSKSKEDQAAQEVQWWHEPQIQAEGVGIFVTNYPPNIDLYENSFSVDMSVDSIKDGSQETQRQDEWCGVMTPKNNTITYFSVNTSYVPMSVDTT